MSHDLRKVGPPPESAPPMTAMPPTASGSRYGLPAGDFCTWQAPPEWLAGHPCPLCGHSDLAHVGVEHCPVCELVYQATPMFRRREERIHGPRRVWMREC